VAADSRHLSEGSWESDVMGQIAAHEDSILAATMNGETLCPNCKGKGCEGLGLLEADWPCRRCSGRGLL
jgi:DnaJ-class molecular chaperone